MSEIQKELDKFEEFVLTEIFGDIHNPKISKNIQIALTFKGTSFDNVINLGINKFEEYIKNYLCENGFLDVKKILDILSIKFPFLSTLNPPPVRLIEVAKIIDQVFPLKIIGEIIRKF